MSTLYQVKNWDRNFETAKSRTYSNCSHVYVPNKQHGMGFIHIISQPDGAAILGVWYLIIEALSMQPKPRQGYLTDTGKPLSKDTIGDQPDTTRPWQDTTLSLRWRRPIEEIQRALEVLSSKEVGWLREVSKDTIGDQPDTTGDCQGTIEPLRQDSDRTQTGQDSDTECARESLSLFQSIKATGKMPTLTGEQLSVWVHGGKLDAVVYAGEIVNMLQAHEATKISNPIAWLNSTYSGIVRTKIRTSIPEFKRQKLTCKDRP